MKLLDLLSNLTLEYEEEKLLLDTCASLQQYQFEPWYQLVFTMMYLAVVVGGLGGNLLVLTCVTRSVLLQSPLFSIAIKAIRAIVSRN